MSSCDPWPWYSDPEGPYDGATPVWIEEYRTWNIWDLTEVEPGAHTYGASDPYCVGKGSFSSTLSGIKSLIDGWIGPGIPTSLTIEAPETVEPEETFSLTGILYETETGVPIPNQIIVLSYNGVTIGDAVTGIDGDYLMQAMIPTSGSYTIKASFTGTLALGASASSSRVSTGGLSLARIAAVALIAFALLKK